MILISVTLLLYISTAQVVLCVENTCTESFTNLKNITVVIPLDTDCQELIYSFKLNSRSSIMSVTLQNDIFQRSLAADTTTMVASSFISNEDSSNYSMNTVTEDGIRLKKNPPDDSANILAVIFEEFDKDIEAHVSLNKWKLTPRNIKTGDYVYFSRSTSLTLRVQVKEISPGYDVKLICEELAFEMYDTNEPNKSIIPSTFGKLSYRPNKISTYRIQKPREMNARSIALTLWYSDIDDGIGEYLLIGAGTNPVDGAPPLFLGEPQMTPKFFQIEDVNAYIVFVARSTRGYHRRGFRIDWKFIEGTPIDEEKEKEKKTRDEDVLESLQICISNISAAQAEFEKRDGQFLQFREDIAKIASQYAKNKSLRADVNYEKVSIFRVSAEDTNSEDGGMLYVMMKIQGSKIGKAAFTWDQLKDIFEHYSKTPQTSQNFKIKKCPELLHTWTRNIGFYAIVPAILCLLLLIWTWKYNPLSTYFMKQSMTSKMSKWNGYLNGDTAENMYEAYPRAMPSVRLTDDCGRRYTMDFSQTMVSLCEEAAETADGNKISEETEPKLSFRSGGIDNQAFSDCQAAIDSAGGSTSQRSSAPAENFYDTVKSSESKATCVTGETKL